MARIASASESRSEEVIVVSEVMGLDSHFVGFAVAGGDGLWRLALSAGEASLVNEGAHEAGPEGARGEGRGDAELEVVLAVQARQAVELAHLVVELDASSSDFLQVDATRVGKRGDAVAALGPPCAGARPAQRCDVSGVFDVS